MIPNPDLILSIQRDRAREADASRLARLAVRAWRCCTAPASRLARFARLVRPVPQCC